MRGKRTWSHANAFQIGWFFEGRVNVYFRDLLVIHGEDAVPVEWWLIEEIFLPAFPLGPARALCWRCFKDGLEGLLCKVPLSSAIERARSREAGDEFRCLRGNLRASANQFVNCDRLQLAFDPNLIKLSEG